MSSSSRPPKRSQMELQRLYSGPVSSSRIVLPNSFIPTELKKPPSKKRPKGNSRSSSTTMRLLAQPIPSRTRPLRATLPVISESPEEALRRANQRPSTSPSPATGIKANTSRKRLASGSTAAMAAMLAKPTNAAISKDKNLTFNNLGLINGLQNAKRNTTGAGGIQLNAAERPVWMHVIQAWPVKSYQQWH
eukprot:616371-Pleurochrysis_carterae.AAC.1